MDDILDLLRSPIGDRDATYDAAFAAIDRLTPDQAEAAVVALALLAARGDVDALASLDAVEGGQVGDAHELRRAVLAQYACERRLLVIEDEPPATTRSPGAAGRRSRTIGTALAVGLSLVMAAAAASPAAADTALTTTTVEQVSGHDGRVELDWPTVPGATAYTVRRDGEVIATTRATAFIDRDRTNGAAHTYTVVADGRGDLVLDVVTAAVDRDPVTGAELRFSPLDGGLEATIVLPRSETTGRARVVLDDRPIAEVAFAGRSVLSIPLAGIAEDALARIRVLLEDAVGNVRELVPDTTYGTVALTDLTPPPLPVDLGVGDCLDGIDLTWSTVTSPDPDDRAVEHELQRRGTLGAWSTVATVHGDRASDPGVWVGTYRLVAIDAAGNRSAPSEPFSVARTAVGCVLTHTPAVAPDLRTRIDASPVTVAALVHHATDVIVTSSHDRVGVAGLAILVDGRTVRIIGQRDASSWLVGRATIAGLDLSASTIELAWVDRTGDLRDRTVIGTDIRQHVAAMVRDPGTPRLGRDGTVHVAAPAEATTIELVVDGRIVSTTDVAGEAEIALPLPPFVARQVATVQVRFRTAAGNASGLSPAIHVRA